MGGGWICGPASTRMSMDGTCPRAFLPGLTEAERRGVYYYAIFPNMLLSLHPDYMMVHTLWPIAPDRTINICEWHFHPPELARPGFDPADAIEFWDMTNRQDWHVCELSQAGISSRAYTPGPYSNREDLLYAFDRMIVGVARARCGRRLRQPRVTATTSPTPEASDQRRPSARRLRLARVEERRLHDRRADPVADGFDRDLDLQRACRRR